LLNCVFSSIFEFFKEEDPEMGGGNIKRKNQNKKLMRLKQHIAAEKLKKRNLSIEKKVAAESAAQQQKAKQQSRTLASGSDSDSDGSSSGSSSSSSSSSDSDSDSDSDSNQTSKMSFKSRRGGVGQLDSLMKRKNAGVLNSDRANIMANNEDEEEDDEHIGGVMTLKRRIGIDDSDDDDDGKPLKALEDFRRPRKKIRVDGHGRNKNRIKFNEDGNDISEETPTWRADNLDEETESHMNKLANRLQAADEQDKITNKERVRAMKKMKKLKEKELEKEDSGEDIATGMVEVGSSEEDSEDESEKEDDDGVKEWLSKNRDT